MPDVERVVPMPFIPRATHSRRARRANGYAVMNALLSSAAQMRVATFAKIVAAGVNNAARLLHLERSVPIASDGSL